MVSIRMPDIWEELRTDRESGARRLVAKWLRQAAQNGWESARQLIGSCGADPDDGRLYAEVRILLLKELERLRQEELAKEADDIDADQFMLAPSVESEKDSQYGDAWLLKNLPAGTKVPEVRSEFKMLMTISKIRAVIVGII